MNLRFDQPLWLLLPLLVIPMAWIALRWFGAMSRSRRWSAILLRTLLFVALAAMLAGATLLRPTDRLAVVAVVDTSASIDRYFDAGISQDGTPLSAGRAIARFLSDASTSRQSDDLIGIVTFDGHAAAAQPLQRAGRVDALSQPTFGASDEGTDIESALRLAGAMLPSDAVGRIVLFSDGVATAGNATRAAAALAGRATSGSVSDATLRRIPIDVVPLNYNVSTEVFVDSIDSPPTAPARSSVSVRIVLTSAGHATGTLQVLHEGEPADINGAEPGNGLRLTLRPGANMQQVAIPLGEGRVHRFEAVWEPDPIESVAMSGGRDGSGGVQDTILTNNRATSFTVAPGRGSVLLVDGVSGGDPAGPGATLARTLRAAELDVQTVGPDAVQSDLLWLQAFDLIILQNVPADALPRRTQEALAGYVTQLGGGLVMVGGPDSFGPGGWKGSEIEPLLPVTLDLPERLVTPAAAVVIIIDNSGSMNRGVMGSDRSQQEIANEGAAVAIESMDKNDLVGVISFNSEHTVEVPLGPNRDPTATAGKVRSISADGGTFLPPALEEAYRQLRNVTADVKHVIVLSDGVSQGTETLPGIVRRMAADKIAVSTIAVGDGADTQVMSQMAALGGGQFYRVIDPTLLPRIFLKAVRVVRSPMIRESPFQPVIRATGSPVMEGITTADMPRLGGLVITQQRIEPTVLTPMVTATGEPVLAYWNAGLGRVAAFTSDAHRWAGDWIAWPGYARFWTQLVRTIARPPTDRTQTLTAEIDGDQMRVRLDATRDDGAPLDLLSVPGIVYAPDGARTNVQLSQIGPGQYEAALPAPTSGAYVITLTPRLGDKMLAPVIGGVSRPAGAEFRRLSSDPDALRRIAELTGGRVLSLSRPDQADLFDRRGVKPAESHSPLWRLIAIWAIVLLLLDVATRRIAWDRFLSREFGADLKRDAAATVRERGTQAQAAVERLRQRDDQIDAPFNPVIAPSTLGDDDAQRIIREQAARRRAARAAAVASNTSPDDVAAAPVTPTNQPASQPPVDDGGLLAAKRRARKKFDEEQAT